LKANVPISLPKPSLNVTASSHPSNMNRSALLMNVDRQVR
jgi:hypothetical protein